MKIRPVKFASCAVMLMCVALLPSITNAQGLTEGNILVSQYDTGSLSEFTPSGVLVQTFNIPAVGSSLPSLRDIVVGQSGNVFAYSGTFDPTLATLNSSTGSITRDSFDGWSTINNVSYGGIGGFGQYVYATDMSTAGDGSPFGIVRFDTQGGETVRFGNNNYIDLTVSGDGLIYALRSGVGIDVYDPATNQQVSNFNLSGTTDVRGIAVDRDGTVFAASWNELVTSHDADGDLINSFEFDGNGLFDNDLTDIDINDNGDVLVSSRFGGLLMGDSSLSEFTSFNYGTGVVHATFVSSLTVVPEPGALFVLTCSAGLLLFRRNRRL